MPDLNHLLRSQDLGFLKIVADLWGVELEAPDARTALSKLPQQLLTPALALEIVAALPEEARQALDALILHSGVMTWQRFTRQFGSLREMGAGKRDRDKPHLAPVSATEILWYRSLIGRGFLKHQGELQECVYVPDDLLKILPPVSPSEPLPPGRAASPGETKYIMPVSDRILDHTCTLLAALRMEDARRSPAVESWLPPFKVVHALLAAMKLITSNEQPVPEDARPFLEMPRGEALGWLAKGWRETPHFNELQLMPGVICEGSWHNNPVHAREKILAHLSDVPEDTWWNLASFINAIHEREPDYQRQAGDFDTWLVRDTETGESLAGISHWDSVDGALVRFLITGPMHWLGLMDLASREDGGDASAFRFSKWAEKLLMGQPIEMLSKEDHLIEPFSDGKLIASPYTPRLARYQVSRFCLWIEETDEEYTYQLSPRSLAAVAEQGLKIVHLETLLKKYASPPPPNLIQALRHWEQKGGQVYIYPGIVLRVAKPQILQALRDSPAGRFIDEPLGPTAVIIQPNAVEKVTSALARLGYLSEVDFTEQETNAFHSPGI